MIGRGEVAGGVVHHDVEPTVVGDDPVDDTLHRGRVADVTRVDVHVDAVGLELRRRRVERLLLAAGDGDASAVTTEGAADLLADPGGTPGDERDLPGEQIGTEGGLRGIGHAPILAEPPGDARKPRSGAPSGEPASDGSPPPR